MNKFFINNGVWLSMLLALGTLAFDDFFGEDDIESGTDDINNNSLTFTSLYDGDNYETTFVKN